MDGGGRVRIGELAARLGVGVERLRAWERRYGLLRPIRTAGGFRLYSAADEARARRALEHIAGGYSAAEAARLAIAEVAWPQAERSGMPLPEPDVLRRQVLASLLSFDEAAAQAALDRVLAEIDLDTAIRAVVLPCLREIGRLWALGTVSVAQEHFASGLVEGRLLSLSRAWARDGGPLALLACAPAERHSLGLLCHGLALRSRGWRVTYLGPDTPVGEAGAAAAAAGASAIVVAAVSGERFADAAAELRALAADHAVAIGGAGASSSMAERIGATALAEDPVDAAEALTAARR